MTLDLTSFLVGVLVASSLGWIGFKVASRLNSQMMAVKELEIARLSLAAPVSDRLASAETQLQAQGQLLDRLDTTIGQAVTLMIQSSREGRESQVGTGYPAVRTDGPPSRLIPPPPRELSETS